MDTYQLADGSKLVLAFRTPEEWAGITRAQLVGLGCSPEYADRRAELIRSAEPGWFGAGSSDAA